MNRSNRKTKKGMNPLVAVGLFVVCAGIAGKSLLGLGAAPPAVPAGDAGAEVSGEEVAAEEGATEATVEWHDLLAVHGSFDRQSNVQLAFRVVEDAAAVVAAPAVETAPRNGSAWIGTDPPALRLGVVMVSGATRRAVLGGRVVGVGDLIADGKVAAIEPGQVTLAWNSRQLNYTLDSDVAVEFRVEHARREAAKQAVATPTVDSASGDDAELDDETADPAALAEKLVKAKQAADKAAETDSAAGKNDTKSKNQKPTKLQKKEAGK